MEAGYLAIAFGDLAKELLPVNKAAIKAVSIIGEDCAESCGGGNDGDSAACSSLLSPPLHPLPPFSDPSDCQ
jgi:hypothetical protein